MLGLANLVLAIIAVSIAAPAKSGPELAMAEDLRKLSAAAVETDFQSGQVLGDPVGWNSFEAAAALLRVPALASIIGTLRRTMQHKK